MRIIIATMATLLLANHIVTPAHTETTDSMHRSMIGGCIYAMKGQIDASVARRYCSCYVNKALDQFSLEELMSFGLVMLEDEERAGEIVMENKAFKKIVTSCLAKALRR